MQQVFQCYRCGAQNYVGQPACWNCKTPFNWQQIQSPPVYQQPLNYQQQSSNYQQYQPSTQEVLDAVVEYVVARVAEGGNKVMIKYELIGKGISDAVASEITERVFSYKSNVVRRNGGIQLGIGLLMAIGGVVLTFLGYTSTSKYFIVWWGLILVGVINVLVGLFRLIRG